MANYFNPCNCQGFYNNPDRQTTPGQFSPGNVNGSPSVTALPPLPQVIPQANVQPYAPTCGRYTSNGSFGPLYGT